MFSFLVLVYLRSYIHDCLISFQVYELYIQNKSYYNIRFMLYKL